MTTPKSQWQNLIHHILIIPYTSHQPYELVVTQVGLSFHCTCSTSHVFFFSLYLIPHCHKSFSIPWIFWGDIHSLLGLLEMLFFMFYSVDLQLTNVSLISMQILLYIVGYLLLLLFFYYLNLHMLIYSLSGLFIWFWWCMNGYWEIM